MNTLSNKSAASQPESDNPSDPSRIKSIGSQDLPDSPQDQESMKEESFTLDLPDVSDIPGQEHVHVPGLGDLSDVTASSDDEEGVGLFDDEEDEDLVELNMGNGSDVNLQERRALKTAAEDMPTEDNFLLREAALDNRDDEGAALNEGSSATRVSGKDLDIPGAEEDDTDEVIGEEDEENNPYSLGGDDNDEIPADSF
ncbi:MAG: hypothetical protein ABIN89_01400 [Chitinophagaceae bacterium]